ncbi:MFS general substrate transporter [Cucurbitaria berberidis CBS 394.84]|uniref:MFS general substrate transporter n=1 Tax=Cucurbitaria berberidis CBS 394.84 TaxID=1168544 RepID=A0A9P4GDE0_9PLEO|nr:MFS general substrate transporter [Cucurbitaria berberidis CBS 394.84]KAF1843160.1 MFS general substrate transporter [Cucurbitaria berberidis CBS 394.84]
MAGEQSFELHEASRPQAATQIMPPYDAEEPYSVDVRLHKRTLLKLDCLLLPFLALLFLFNALDKANIGNAESAHFTTDIGLDKGDVNTAVALFFAFFVALQPVGAALGRRYGMVLWVPSCMVLWGISTALHAWVRYRWQLYTLRIIIGCLEAGFYPVTVTYLSLFYTRFEFGRRLSLFYGQAAVGGALGGILSYFVFSRFRRDNIDGQVNTRWRPWQILFLLEGTLTVVVAFLGYFWLPHSVETAWFLTPEERQHASSRVVRDRDMQNVPAKLHREETEQSGGYDEESRTLLNSSEPSKRTQERDSLHDRGLSPHDIFSSLFNPRIWHILVCNILSAVPVYAFSVFLPLVLAPLTTKSNPALVNLLTAPPHLCGAITLFFFALYSDKHRIRLFPILSGLAIMAVGLITVTALPTTWVIPRYLALNVLLSGTYVASPLTVAWISGNTPSPGKRALLLGINGWGNLAGIFSAMLFKPKYAESGYIVPFWWTLVCVAFSALGYVLFLGRLRAENAKRKDLLSRWSAEDVENEKAGGIGPLPLEQRWVKRVMDRTRRYDKMTWLTEWLEEATQGGRQGDDKITFTYGL